LVGLLTISACNKTETNTNMAKPANTTAATAPRDNSIKPPTFSSTAPDTGEAVKFPLDGFPAVEAPAKAGEYVLVPSYNWIKDAAEKGVQATSFIW